MLNKQTNKQKKLSNGVVSFECEECRNKVPCKAKVKILIIYAESDTMVSNGTFKTVPLIFSQIYTIHGLLNNRSVPLIYVLLPDKCQTTIFMLIF